MASLTITIPDALAADVLAALKWKYPQVDVEGRTALGAARRILRHMLVEVYREYRWAQKNIELETQFNVTRDAEKAALDAELAAITG